MAKWLSLWYSTIFFWLTGYPYCTLLSSVDRCAIPLVLYYHMLAHWLSLWYSTIICWPICWQLAYVNYHLACRTGLRWALHIKHILFIMQTKGFGRNICPDIIPDQLDSSYYFRYASQYIWRNLGQMRLKSRVHQWLRTGKVTLSKLKGFLAVIFNMGLDKNPTIAQYWCAKRPSNQLHGSERCLVEIGSSLSSNSYISQTIPRHQGDTNQSQSRGKISATDQLTEHEVKIPVHASKTTLGRRDFDRDQRQNH